MLHAKKIAALVIMAINFSASAATDIYAGKVNFTGVVEDAACAISAGDVAGQTVDLGNVRLGEISGSKGKAAAAKTPFSITLEECSNVVASSAKIKFSGTTAPDLDTVLIGGTTDVGIQIFDKANPNQALSFGSDSAPYTLASGETKLDFTAGFASATASPASGLVNATANFQVTYN